MTQIIVLTNSKNCKYN